MMIRILVVAILLSNWTYVMGQSNFAKGEITDARDGKIYQTVRIDNTIWLAENMKYKTAHADDSVMDASGTQLADYYYPYEDIAKACPSDFRIPRQSDWDNYIERLLQLKNIHDSSIESFETTSKRVSGSGKKVVDNSLRLFDEPNPLNLAVSGMTQGDQFLSDGALTFWSRKDNSEDAKYHFHIEQNVYSNHTHKHHVIASEKKKRRFVVRCVKDVINQKK